MAKKDDKKTQASRSQKADGQEYQQVNDSENQVEKISQRIEDLENQVKRVLADYQNLEKRNRDERVQWIQTANKELLLRLLPVLDTLMLASIHSDDQSLKVATQQFLDVLKGEGVTQIETHEKEFDPVTMECIAIETGKENKVLEELRPGFLLNDMVLRPAQVKVGKKE